MQNKLKSEQGITLIALLVMIIILVILSAVVIRTLTGDDALISTSTKTKEDYKYTHYGEQVKQVVQGEIVSKSAIGEIASIQNVQEALQDEEWVKTAKIDEGSTEEEGIITVKVVEGYQYEVYYNLKYGKIIVDTLGKDIPQADLDSLTVTGRYEIQRGKPVVFGTAEDKGRGVRTLELYLNETDEKVGDTKENPKGEQSWQVEKTGWYKIKGTSNSGAVKYAYVRIKNISDMLKPPKIDIEPQGTQKEGWYGADGKELWIKVSTDNKYAKEIHYTLTGGQLADDAIGELKEESGQKYIRFEIKETGITNIIAWTEDGTGNSSEEATDVTKFDNIPPEIIRADIEGTAGDNGWYKSKTVSIVVDALDLNGKTNLEEEEKRKTLNGYIYKVIDETGTTKQEKTKENPETDLSKKITITEDGKYKISIQAIDKAGNISAETKLELNKDSTPPTVGTLRIENITGKSFDINVPAGDNLSGIASYEYKINGTKQNVENKNIANITGLTADQTYSIEVTVKDNAGNEKTAVSTASTVNQAPTVTANYANDKGTNYIKINALGKDSDGDNLTYTLYVRKNGETNWDSTKSTPLTNQPENTPVSMTASGLEEYTEYYWKVEVTDSKLTTDTGEQGWIRTYCPGKIQCERKNC